MPYRVDYRETVALTKSQHDAVAAAIETWVAADPDRHAPTVRRNLDTGESEIHVYIKGLTYDQVAAMQETLKTATQNLPESWPDPTVTAAIHQYE